MTPCLGDLHPRMMTLSFQKQGSMFPKHSMYATFLYIWLVCRAHGATSSSRGLALGPGSDVRCAPSADWKANMNQLRAQTYSCFFQRCPSGQEPCGKPCALRPGSPAVGSGPSGFSGRFTRPVVVRGHRDDEAPLPFVRRFWGHRPNTS